MVDWPDTVQTLTVANNLMIKNIAMNDKRNGGEYQCLISGTGRFSDKEVEWSNITILAGEYQYGIMHM